MRQGLLSVPSPSDQSVRRVKRGKRIEEGETWQSQPLIAPATEWLHLQGFADGLNQGANRSQWQAIAKIFNTEIANCVVQDAYPRIVRDALQCQWTLTLDNGTIQVAGREFDKGTSSIAIVGGTGAYTGISGQMESTNNEDGTFAQ